MTRFPSPVGSMASRRRQRPYRNPMAQGQQQGYPLRTMPNVSYPWASAQGGGAPSMPQQYSAAGMLEGLSMMPGPMSSALFQYAPNQFAASIDPTAGAGRAGAIWGSRYGALQNHLARTAGAAGALAPESAPMANSYLNYIPGMSPAAAQAEYGPMLDARINRGMQSRLASQQAAVNRVPSPYADNGPLALAGTAAIARQGEARQAQDARDAMALRMMTEGATAYSPARFDMETGERKMVPITSASKPEMRRLGAMEQLISQYNAQRRGAIESGDWAAHPGAMYGGGYYEREHDMSAQDYLRNFWDAQRERHNRLRDQRAARMTAPQDVREMLMTQRRTGATPTQIAQARMAQSMGENPQAGGDYLTNMLAMRGLGGDMDALSTLARYTSDQARTAAEERVGMVQAQAQGMKAQPHPLEVASGVHGAFGPQEDQTPEQRSMIRQAEDEALRSMGRTPPSRVPTQDDWDRARLESPGDIATGLRRAGFTDAEIRKSRDVLRRQRGKQYTNPAALWGRAPWASYTAPGAIGELLGQFTSWLTRPALASPIQ